MTWIGSSSPSHLMGKASPMRTNVSHPGEQNNESEIPDMYGQGSQKRELQPRSPCVHVLQFTKAGQDAPDLQAGEEWPFLVWGRGGWFSLPENTPMQAHRHSHRLAAPGNSRSH